jgi:hypothetical protein
MTPLERAEKYERVAFMFCKMGTTGLIVWLLTPPIFVLIVAAIATILYAYSFSLGLIRSRCFLRKPLLIMSTWIVIGALDIAWLVLR